MQVQTMSDVHFHCPTHERDIDSGIDIDDDTRQRLRLNLAAVQDTDGKIDESRITVEKAGPMHVFNENFPLPARALRDAAAVEDQLRKLQK